MLISVSFYELFSKLSIMWVDHCVNAVKTGISTGTLSNDWIKKPPPRCMFWFIVQLEETLMIRCPSVGEKSFFGAVQQVPARLFVSLHRYYRKTRRCLSLCPVTGSTATQNPFQPVATEKC